MKQELSIKALRLYGSKFGVPHYSPSYISYTLIPLFRRLGYVWIQSASVVKYCHQTKPKEFGHLNQHNLIIAPHQTMNNGRDTRSFRLIKVTEFERITGIKFDG